MTSWKPPMRPGVHVVVAAMGVLLIVESYVLWNLFGRDLDLGSFLLAALALLGMVLLAALGYLLYGLARLGYTVDSEALTIRWGAVQHVLPLSSISDVSGSYPSGALPSNSGISWPGYHVGRGIDDQGRKVLFFATSRSPDLTASVATAEAVYAISPRERDSFINTLNRCRSRPLAQHATLNGLTPIVLAPRLLGLPYWQDRVVLAILALALLGNLAIFAYVSFKFPFLPPVLPLHYNVLGEIDFLGTRAESFKIPAIGTAVLGANFVFGLMLHSRERLGAYLLLGSAALVQVVLLVATVKILL